MLIRSQDKVDLIVLENILTIFLVSEEYDEHHFITAFFSSENICNEDASVALGVYSSHEKALKVLDMIADSYRYNHGMVVSRGHIPDPVFQMPQDDEVEA